MRHQSSKINQNIPEFRNKINTCHAHHPKGWRALRAQPSCSHSASLSKGSLIAPTSAHVSSTDVSVASTNRFPRISAAMAEGCRGHSLSRSGVPLKAVLLHNPIPKMSRRFQGAPVQQVPSQASGVLNINKHTVSIAGLMEPGASLRPEHCAQPSLFPQACGCHRPSDYKRLVSKTFLQLNP